MAGRKTKNEAVKLKAEIKELQNQGLSISEIADQTNSQRSTVKHYVDQIESEQNFDFLDNPESTEFEDISSLEKATSERINLELRKSKPNHLLIEKLSNRQLRLLELKSQLQNNTPSAMPPSPKARLSQDQKDRIANIICEDL